MKIYFIKLSIRGINPMIWRRLKLPGNISLAKLHYIIQTLFGWRDKHLHLFHIYGKDYGIARAGGLDFDDGNHPKPWGAHKKSNIVSLHSSK